MGSTDKVDKLMKQRDVIAVFSIAVKPHTKVRVKEILKTHNKELKWRYAESEYRDEEGYLNYELLLINEGLAVDDITLVRDLIHGLWKDLLERQIFNFDDESIEALNQSNMNLIEGKIINTVYPELKNRLDNNELFFVIKEYLNTLAFVHNANKLVQLENESEAFQRVSGFAVLDWYEESVAKINKRIISNAELENAILTVKRFEKIPSLNKLPHNKHKKRIKF